MSTTPDPVATYLAEVRFDLEGPHPRPLAYIASRHAPALLGALEAVLALADDSDARAMECASMTMTETLNECASRMRTAISAALTGTESTDGP